MAAIKVLVDTGPLVGYLNRNHQYHAWAVECWSALFDPLWTCEAVVSEAIFVLQSDRVEIEPLLRLIDRRLVRIDFIMDHHRMDVMRLLRKYADQPMSVADRLPRAHGRIGRFVPGIHHRPGLSRLSSQGAARHSIAVAV